MDTAILFFMGMAVVLAIFTIGVVIGDIRRERKKKRESSPEQAQPKSEPAEDNQAQQVTATEQGNHAQQITVEGSVVAIPLEEYEGQIRFSADPKLSHKAKYLALSAQQKAWYDEIAEYANSIDDIKFVTTNGYDEYRLYGKRVVRLRIKKGVVMCEFLIANPNFSRYVTTNKVTVKQAPTTLKLVENRDVGAAKDSIDIAIREIREEREEAKRMAKQRRRLARQSVAATRAKPLEGHNSTI